MRGRAGGVAGQGWVWWALALLLALMMVGHDALMAGNAHAAEPHAGVHAEDRRSQPHGADEAGVERGEGTVPDQPLACDVVRPQAAPAGNDTNPAMPVATVGPAPAYPLPAVPAAPRWETPTESPGVRRALTQVYRI